MDDLAAGVASSSRCSANSPSMNRPERRSTCVPLMKRSERARSATDTAAWSMAARVIRSARRMARWSTGPGSPGTGPEARRDPGEPRPPGPGRRRGQQSSGCAGSRRATSGHTRRLLLNDEFEADVEGAIGLSGSPITGGQRDAVFGGCGGDERVVDGTARDTELRQADMETFRALGAQEPGVREVVREQAGDSRGVRGSAAAPGEDRKGLEGRVAAEPAAAVADGLPGGLMVFVSGGASATATLVSIRSWGWSSTGRHRAASGRDHHRW